MKRRSLAQAALLLVLAPVCAEYLSAYDDSTGDPVALITGLAFFIPLYGAPALIIREVARRAGLGWGGILLMATAAGFLQAGLIDQSLFSTDYRQIESWEEGFRRTLIAPWGLSAFNLLNFVGGHAIFSFCAPIALIEATRPSFATRPWVGKLALGVLSLAWLVVAAMILHHHLTTETSHASRTQLIATAMVIVGLVVAALRVGRKKTRGPSRGTVPPLLAVGLLTLVLAGVVGVVPESWGGVGVMTGGYIVAGAVIWVWSRRPGWGLRHVAVAAVAPLLVRTLLAFTYAPLVGDVTDADALGHHVVMLLIVLVVAALALRPQRSETNCPSEGVAVRG